jgi:hypothetical protein
MNILEYLDGQNHGSISKHWGSRTVHIYCTVVTSRNFFQVAFLINITVTTDAKKTFISAAVFK